MEEKIAFVLFAGEAPIYVSPFLQNEFNRTGVKFALSGDIRRQIISIISEPEKKSSIIEITRAMKRTDSAPISGEVHYQLEKHGLVTTEKATREEKASGTAKRIIVIPKIYFFDVENLDTKEIIRRISMITNTDVEAKKKIEKCIEKDAMIQTEIVKQTKLPAYLVEAILTTLDYKKEVEKISSFRLVKKS